MVKKKHIPVVWQLSALHLNEGTLISGVLIKNVPYNSVMKSSLKNLVNLINLYLVKTFANKKITIQSNGHFIKTVTDNKGYFRVITKNLHKGELTISLSGELEPIKIIQDYPIIFKKTYGKIDVISDIDETILVSHTSSFFQRISTLAFNTVQQRELIPFTKRMLKEFELQNSRIVYVSKSESNLFKLLTNFIQFKKLPIGKLFLTPYLNFRQLLFSKKKSDFKIEVINSLIEHTNPKPYVLIGDDSQSDMEVYYEIAKKFPNRILKVYIRKTKPNMGSYKESIKEKFRKNNTPIHYFLPEDEINVTKEFNQLLK